LPEPAIQLIDVTKYYGDHRALDAGVLVVGEDGVDHLVLGHLLAHRDQAEAAETQHRADEALHVVGEGAQLEGRNLVAHRCLLRCRTD